MSRPEPLSRRSLLRQITGGGAAFVGAGAHTIGSVAALQAPFVPATGVFNVSLPPYSADPNGVDDATDVIQQAILDASASGYGGIVRIPFGRYRISHTLTWEEGCAIEGLFGSGDNAEAVRGRFPYLLWAGPSDQNVLETRALDPPNNWTWAFFRRISIVNEVGYSFRSGVVYMSRVDSTLNSDFQIAGADDYAIEYRGGGINVVLSDWRTDGCRKGSIRFVGTAQDSLTLDRFTTDNQVASDSVSGSTLVYDGDATPPTGNFTLAVKGASKLETNRDLPIETPAQFYFRLNPAITTGYQVMASFDSVWQAQDPSVTRFDGIHFHPPSDSQTLRLNNTKGLSVVGVPAYRNSLIGKTAIHSSSDISPSAPYLERAPEASSRAHEIVGALNIIGSYYHHGHPASLISHIAGSEAGMAGTTLYEGELIMDPATRGSGHRILREVTGAGTLGVLSGVTATTTSDSLTVHVSGTHRLRIGQFITVDGGFTQKMITGFDLARRTITVQNGNSISAVTDAAMSWVAPTFSEGQVIPLVGSTTWDPGSIPNGGHVSIEVTILGAEMGDFAVVSFSEALPGGCILHAAVTALNQITVTFANITGSPIDLSAGTLRVRVSRY